MKVLDLKLALPAAILAIIFLGVGHTDGTGTPTPSEQTLQAKIRYCYDCHGALGRGYRGFFTMPRLAGQTTEYLENQLKAFVERRRGTIIGMKMSKVHGLSPEMQAALATHFTDLNPKPFGRAPRVLANTGKTIYEEGVPDDNVAACAACHGPEAKGSRANPRLAGQLYPYTVKVLANWSKDRGQGGTANPDTSAIMRPIAQSLTKSQIEAVAAYLSYLE